MQRQAAASSRYRCHMTCGLESHLKACTPKGPCSQRPELPKARAPKGPCSQMPVLPKARAPKGLCSQRPVLPDYLLASIYILLTAATSHSPSEFIPCFKMSWMHIPHEGMEILCFNNHVFKEVWQGQSATLTLRQTRVERAHFSTEAGWAVAYADTRII